MSFRGGAPHAVSWSQNSEPKQAIPLPLTVTTILTTRKRTRKLERFRPWIVGGNFPELQRQTTKRFFFSPAGTPNACARPVSRSRSIQQRQNYFHSKCGERFATCLRFQVLLRGDVWGISREFWGCLSQFSRESLGSLGRSLGGPSSWGEKHHLKQHQKKHEKLQEVEPLVDCRNSAGTLQAVNCTQSTGGTLQLKLAGDHSMKFLVK